MLVDPAGLNSLTERINRCAFRVHSELGPGLLEKAYKLALAKELLLAGLAYKLDVPLTTTYRGIVEIKAVTFNHPVHRAQLVTYLRLTGLPVGLLMNFHARRMKDGISRVLNDRPRPATEEY